VRHDIWDYRATSYRTVCQTCHGTRGEGIHARSGVPGMPTVSFASVYSLEELHDVASYVADEMLSRR
jgi:cytochrome c553